MTDEDIEEAKELSYKLDISIIEGDIDRACDIAKKLASMCEAPKDTLGRMAIVCFIMSAERVINDR